MPLLWTPWTVPELAAMRRLPPAERRAIGKRTWPKIRRHWQIWVAAVVAVGVAVGIYIPVSRLLLDQGIGGFVNGALSGALAGLAAGTLLGQVLNRVAVPYWREELAARSPTE